MNKLRILCSLLLVCFARNGRGMEFRSYHPEIHRRFLTLSPVPVLNPAQLYAAYDLSGIGWRISTPDIQAALISRQHAVFANHYGAHTGGNWAFLALDGTVHTRKVAATANIVQNGEPTDLLLITFEKPVPASSGVTPLPYLDVSSYRNTSIGVVARRVESGLPKFSVIGRSKIHFVQPEPTPGEEESGLEGFTTRNYSFRYTAVGLSDDDCYLQAGDSGAPSFAITREGQAAVVGVHSYVDSSGQGPLQVIDNFDILVPHYVGELDAILHAAGYRCTPANAPMTSTALTGSVTTTVPRRGHPLSVHFTLENTGPNPTGNVELETPLPGPAGSRAAPAWKVYPDILRLPLLAPGASASVTLTWEAAPFTDTLEIPLAWRSDKAAPGMQTITIALAPSYLEYVRGLDDQAQDADPDCDGIPNLLEYALGGDPALASQNQPATGLRLLPETSIQEGRLQLTFPERLDAQERGLSYRWEFSADLEVWSGEPPEGHTSELIPYPPPVTGFAQRRVTFPPSSTPLFARLRILLDE